MSHRPRAGASPGRRDRAGDRTSAGSRPAARPAGSRRRRSAVARRDSSGDSDRASTRAQPVPTPALHLRRPAHAQPRPRRAHASVSRPRCSTSSSDRDRMVPRQLGQRVHERRHQAATDGAVSHRSSRPANCRTRTPSRDRCELAVRQRHLRDDVAAAAPHAVQRECARPDGDRSGPYASSPIHADRRRRWSASRRRSRPGVMSNTPRVTRRHSPAATSRARRSEPTPAVVALRRRTPVPPAGTRARGATAGAAAVRAPRIATGWRRCVTRGRRIAWTARAEPVACGRLDAMLRSGRGASWARPPVTGLSTTGWAVVTGSVRFRYVRPHALVERSTRCVPCSLRL